MTVKGAVCQAQNKVHKHKKSVLDSINSKLSDSINALTETGKKNVNDANKLRKKSKKNFDQMKADLKNSYSKLPWRNKRPDITFLAELLLVVVLCIILAYVWPYITGSARPGFSRSQFLKATKLPETAFNVEELAKVNIEVQSLTDYGNFFKSQNQPYSTANSGVRDLMITVAILPFLMFFLQFVLPPFVIAYIIWFIIRFWPYVTRAAWGWFKAMYNYFTRMIQGKLGCKWYIRMVTGWSCNRPNFYQYFITWRRRFVDRPIYYEKLKYLQKYYWARNEYYIKPYRKYVTIPYRRYRIKAAYAKNLYINRSIDVFLQKLRKTYPQYYRMPRDEFYRWLLSNNKNMAGVYVKAMQAKAQIEGRPYRSLTEAGRQCTCPATNTPAKAIKKKMSRQVKEAGSDIDTLIKATEQVYDKANKVTDLVEKSVSCQAADTVITKRHSIANTMIITILIALILIYGYSWFYGTPAVIKNMITPTVQYAARGASFVTQGKSYYSLPLIYFSAFSVVLMVIKFS